MTVSDCSVVLESVKDVLWDRFHIAHTTLQFETHGCETTHGCSAPPRPEAVGAHAHHHHGHNHSHSH